MPSRPTAIMMRMPMKHSTPIISESMSLPVINPPKTRWMCATRSIMEFARSMENRLYVIFFAWAQKVSLPFKI